MDRRPLGYAPLLIFVLISAIPLFPAAQVPSPARIAGGGAIPPFVEQQLKARARAENPPPEGLRLSEDGEAYTYASAAAGPAGRRAGAYQATLGRRLSGGMEVFAGGSDLSLKVWPVSDALFTAPAMEKGGRLVFRGRGVRYEYTFKRNGVKEDVVYDAAPCDDVNLVFALQRDPGLDFRLDGKGNLLVYGPNPALSGFVQAGDERSAALVMKARANAKRDRLLFVIPAPVVLDGEGREHEDLARYTLDGNALTIHTEDLSHLAAPVTIDPSIVVSTTADFLQGNDEGLISFDADAVGRSAFDGGPIGSWTGAASFSAARYGCSFAAYNGFLYVLGGYTDAAVEYAPIQADGSIGAWQTTSAMPIGGQFLNPVAYDGYLYVTGGYCTYGIVNTVRFAPIHTDGTLGAWAYTTSFATQRYSHTSVAYNGYLYVMGGSPDQVTQLNDVQYAPIRGDGTVGAWAATTGFPTVRYGHASVVFNGYLYVAGGYTSGQNSLSDVRFAPLRADGTVGDWATTASMPQGRHEFTLTVYGGYLYALGGYGTTAGYLSSVHIAPVHANGTVGPWSWGTSLPGQRCRHATAAYGGYLYFGGGQAYSTFNDVYYAPIRPTNAGLWCPTSPSAFTTARAAHTSVAYNGYLYVLGGTGTLDYLNDVQYASIGADGSVGSFSTTSSFATRRTGHASVAYNGYLYVIGGVSDGPTYLNDVQFAPIAADGTVGAWGSTTGFPASPRYGLAAVACQGHLWVLGGYAPGSTPQRSDVWVATINADGTVSGWTSTTGLPSGRFGHACLAYGGRMYVIGGQASTGYLNDVWFAAIGSDGSLGGWTSTSAFATPRTYHTCAAYDGFLWVAGGTNGSYLGDVQYAALNADGTVGAWGPGTSLPAGCAYHACVAYSGCLFMTGGAAPAYSNTVRLLPVSQRGTVGAWSATGSFTGGRADHAAVACNGYLYVLGGYDFTNWYSDVQYAPIGTGGGIGAWTTSPNHFTTPRAWLAAAAYGGYLYVIGGRAQGGTYLNDVQFAPIHADGSIGAWAPTSLFATARGSHAVAAFNGFLYLLGGEDGTNRYSYVQYAPIHTDGTLGAWSGANGFTTERCSHTAAAYAGYLYVLGGESGAARFNDAQYAPIQADGSIGAWAATSSFDTARTQLASAAYNGFLYVIGGLTSGARNDVQFAPVNSDGTLGNWNWSTRFATARWSHASAFDRGNLYILGGYSGTAMLSDVQMATLRGSEARARYSKLLDLGSDQVVDSVEFSSSGHLGATTITCAAASSSTAAFGGRTVIPGAVPGTPYPGNTCGRWVWVHFDLDDTLSATVDGGGAIGRGDVLDFTVTYSPLQGIGDTLRVTKMSMPASVRLTWEGAAGATAYAVRRCDATAGPCTPETIDTTTGHSYSDLVLGDGVTYWYQVVAVNGNCEAE